MAPPQPHRSIGMDRTRPTGMRGPICRSIANSQHSVLNVSSHPPPVGPAAARASAPSAAARAADSRTRSSQARSPAPRPPRLHHRPITPDLAALTGPNRRPTACSCFRSSPERSSPSAPTTSAPSSWTELPAANVSLSHPLHHAPSLPSRPASIAACSHLHHHRLVDHHLHPAPPRLSCPLFFSRTPDRPLSLSPTTHSPWAVAAADPNRTIEE